MQGHAPSGIWKWEVLSGQTGDQAGPKPERPQATALTNTSIFEQRIQENTKCF